jgi:hypothetical protein
VAGIVVGFEKKTEFVWMRHYTEDGQMKPIDCSRKFALRHLADLITRSKSLQSRVFQY